MGAYLELINPGFPIRVDVNILQEIADSFRLIVGRHDIELQIGFRTREGEDFPLPLMLSEGGEEFYFVQIQMRNGFVLGSCSVQSMAGEHDPESPVPSMVLAVARGWASHKAAYPLSAAVIATIGKYFGGGVENEGHYFGDDDTPAISPDEFLKLVRYPYCQTSSDLEEVVDTYFEWFRMKSEHER